MFERIRTWYAPPQFPDNLDKTRRAALLNAMLLTDIALLTIGLGVNLFFPAPWLVVVLELITVAALSLLRRLLYTGAIQAAAFTSLIFLSLGLAGVLMSLGTINSPLLGGVLLILLAGGMLLDGVSLFILVITNLLLLTLAAVLENLGRLPPPVAATHVSQWIAAVAILIYAAAFTFWTHKDIREALEHARRDLAERRRSNDFLHGIVNTLHDPVVVKDAGHRFLLANDPLCVILGRARSDIIGRVDADFLPADLAAIYWQQDQRVLDTGEPHEYEETVQAAGSSEPMIISTRKTRYVDPQTGERYVVAIIRDLTRERRAEQVLERDRETLEYEVAERTAALTDINTALMTEVSERRIVEEALRASQHELQVLMDTVPGMVVMFRSDGQLIRWNRLYEETLGYSPEELRGMHGELTITPADRTKLSQAVEQIRSEGRSTMELRSLTKDGREIPIFSHGALITGEDGTRYVASVGLDISRLKAAEEGLRSSQRELEVLMSTAPGVVYMFREDGRIVRWNKKFEELSGYSEQELRSLSLADLISQDEIDGLLNTMQAVLSGDQSAVELTIVGRDGRRIPLLATGALIVSETGERFIAGTGVDISDLKEAEMALSRSQGRLRALLDATTDAAFLLTLDGTFVALNQAMARAMDSTVEDLIGVNAFEALPPDLRASRWEYFEQMVRTGKPVRFEDVGINGWSDNSIYPVFSPDGRVEAAALFSRDITEQKRSEAALRESEERYALAARGANDGLWDANLYWDEHGKEYAQSEVYFSPRMRAMLGWDDNMALTDPYDHLVALVHPDDVSRVTEQISDHLAGQIEHLEAEFRVLHADGTYHWMLMRGLAVRTEHGVPYRVAGSISDVTDRKRAEAQLLFDAFHDSLTGLPNRALLEDRLEQVLRHRQRYPDDHFAVLYMDLDRFKDINDSLGHSIGDQLLIAAARRILGCLRLTDTLARLGGDEFVILLPEVASPTDAITVVDRILEQLRQPFVLDGAQVFTSGSIGIVFADESHQQPEEILRDADIAMYRAKASGRARYQVFDASMHSQVVARLRLEAELRKGLEHGEFEVHYMPILRLHDGAFTGYEALVRWRHPQRGLVAPGEFIPLAEDTGLIIPLDRWVLIDACRQILQWQMALGRSFMLNINLSGKQFSQPDLINQIQSALRETGLSPDSLCVEITESAILENIELAISMLRQIQALGVRVEVDDFGTGYSSLTYLMQLPVDGLKIDRSFIRYLGVDPRRTEIVRTIITLAHNIGMTVVAEGIETEAQRLQLAQLGCDYGQGYLLSHPLDCRAATTYVSAGAQV